MGIRGELKFKVFRTSTKLWQTLFEDAAAFATQIGPDRVQNITTSCDHSDSLVTVWYWD